MRVGVLTGGGDCPGLNATLRGLVLAGIKKYGYEFIGFLDGWAGPIENRFIPLDVDTVRMLEQMARRWGVSKSEALRRAIRTASAQARDDEGGPLKALDRLQRSAALSDTKAKDWARRTRATRHAASSRREPSDK